MPTSEPEHERAPTTPAAAGSTPPASEALLTGEDLGLVSAAPPLRIGGYRIVGKLGEGGMGVVYQAVQLSLDRPVALKVIKGAFTSDRPFVARFLREAKVAARIDHANVVAIYDTGEADGHLFTAQQFVPGGDLQQRMVTGGPFPEQAALRISAECCRGLRAIHLAGLVHRDIKPSNIFIAADGSVKIGDLGLVRSVLDDERLTFSGDLVGTPAYMSPEQALAEHDVDARTDLYALGASLFHLLTGQPPFGGRSPFLIGHQVLAEMAPDPREHQPQISAETCAIIHHAMRKERALRYQSADEMVEDLTLVAAGKPLRYARVSTMRAERRATVMADGDRPGGMHRLRAGPALLALAVVLSVACALIIGLHLSGGPAIPAATPAVAADRAAPAFPPDASAPPAEPIIPLPEAILDHDVVEHGAGAPPGAPRSAPTIEPPASAPVIEPTLASTVPLKDAGAPTLGEPPAAPEPPAQAAVTPLPQVSQDRRLAPADVQPPASAAAQGVPQALGRTSALKASDLPAGVADPAADVAPVAAAAPAPAAVHPAAAPPPMAGQPSLRSVPSWASASGLDAAGPWVEIVVGPARQRFRICPAGTFLMGSPLDEEGRAANEGLHRVVISHPYWFADTECTQILWTTVMAANPSSSRGSDLPVDQVSWQAGQEFCHRLSQRVAGLHARLPSEAEWESACRAGSRGPFSGGADPASVAWYAVNADGRPHLVATRQANALGLFDCQGNVWEWCQEPDAGYPGPDQVSGMHVFRGGCWSGELRLCRAAERGLSDSGEGFTGSGVRVAVDAEDR